MVVATEGDVSVEISGKIFFGEWRTVCDLVAVAHAGGIPETQPLGSLSPDVVARIILTRIVLKQLGQVDRGKCA